MRVEEKLEQAGLRGSEIRVYLYLLEHGVSSPPQIALGTGIRRPNCYPLLQSLRERGLIQMKMKGKRKVYVAQDPATMLVLLETQKQMISEALPELRALYAKKKHKPKIKFYEGFDQMKQIWLDSLRAPLVQGITSTTKLFAHDPAFFHRYHKQLKRKGIVLQDILTVDSKGDAVDSNKAVMHGLYQVQYLPKQFASLPVDILIWDDHIALMKIEEPLFATVLVDQDIADTMRIFFNFTWKFLAQR